MADVDFSDQDSARVWFKAQSIEMRCAMTSRGALRVVANVRFYGAEDSGSLALAALRAILTSAGRGLGRPADVEELDSAATAASSAANYLAGEFDSPLADSAYAAAEAASAANSAYSAYAAAALSAIVGGDSALSALSDEAAEKAPDLYARAVWGKTEIPESIATRHLEFLEYLNSDPNWAFWRRWYEEMWEGTFRDWDLAIEVAKIPDDVWEGDDALAKVATEINAIEARLLSKRLPASETLALNLETYRIYGTPAQVANQPLLSATLDQVRDALEDALENPNNGLQDRDLEVRKLNRMLERRANDPQYVEMCCTTVGRSLTLKTTGPEAELPASDENIDLIDALREAAQGIRASHPDIEENRRILSEQAFKETPDSAWEELANAQPLLEAITEGYIQEDFAEDIPLLLTSDMRLEPPALGGAERNPVLARYDEMQRTFGRIARIAIFFKKFPAMVHKIDGSAGYKAAGILLTISGLVTLAMLAF